MKTTWSAGALVISLAAPPSSLAATATSVSQNGITFEFQSAVEHGQFANGDYWVLAPVTITRITPDMVCHDPGGPDQAWRNGWEVNPSISSSTGLSDRCSNVDHRINLSKVPSLPYAASAGESIVKAISRTDLTTDGVVTDRQCVSRAAVLTVLGSAPPDNGATVFRPPYHDTDKILYSTNDMRTDLLPSLNTTPEIVAVMPDVDVGAATVGKIYLDHATPGFLRRALYPTNHMITYSPQNNRVFTTALLRLFLNDKTLAEKMPSLIALTQYAIDQYALHRDGQTYQRGGGVTPGHLINAAWFAFIFQDDTAKSNIATWMADRSRYDESRKINQLRTDNTVGLYSHFAQDGRSSFNEAGYWDALEGISPGNEPDPYRLIDGDHAAAWTNPYVHIFATRFRFSALAMRLLPGVEEFVAWPAFFDFAYRSVADGLRTMPDPCAPVGGTRGVDYGPDPDDTPFHCILDPDVAYFNSPSDWACSPGAHCGRLPQRHGGSINTTSVAYLDPFELAMWNAHAYYSQPSDSCSDMGGVCCIGDRLCDAGSSPASDCGLCCSGSCVDPPQTCVREGYQCCQECDGNGHSEYDDTCSIGGCCDDCQVRVFAPGICVEAEWGELTPPMAVQEDLAASGSALVASPEFGEGSIELAFDVSEAGPFVLQAAVRTPELADAHNSFFVSHNGATSSDDPTTVYHVQVSSGFAWDEVSLSGTAAVPDSEFDPMIWQLDPGLHRFTFWGREQRTELDQVVLASCSTADCSDVKEPTCGTCDDGTCDPGEDCSTCPADCGAGTGEVCCTGELHLGDCCTASDCVPEASCVGFLCVSSGHSAPEAGNGIDDYCDGQADEGCMPSAPPDEPAVSGTCNANGPTGAWLIGALFGCRLGVRRKRCVPTGADRNSSSPSH